MEKSIFVSVVTFRAYEDLYPIDQATEKNICKPVNISGKY
jgi:hypothetical protein